MRHVVQTLALVMIMTGTPLADSRTITCFSDGAIVEIEAAAVRGAAEIPLQPGMLDNTLRITPLGGARIRRVETLPRHPETRGEKELEALLERRNRLEDRLQALSTREEIFTAAVKSQSSKAPRRTKSNPDPLLSIRQGTDFAMAQLEAVNTARRRTMVEMRHLDGRIAELRRLKGTEERIARVDVSPATGRIRARYALAGHSWTPRYDIRMESGGKAGVTLYGRLPAPFPGYLLHAAPGTMNYEALAGALPAPAGSLARFMEVTLPAEEVSFGNGLRPSFSALVTNSGSSHLPAGEASLYRNGEYLGKLVFPGISSGRSRRISSHE
jgi:hypothetical protein